MQRKTLVSTFIAVTVMVVALTPADARHRTFGNGGSNYQSNGTFGLGIELGAPSGLNGKLFLSPNTALNFGLGWLYDTYRYNGEGLHLYLDHLWHPTSLTENPTFKLPLYIGVGGAFWSFNENCRGCAFDTRYSALGLRVPFGIAFDFNNVPLDIFVQVTLVVDLFFGDYRDRFGPGFEGSFGIRYWFD